MECELPSVEHEAPGVEALTRRGSVDRITEDGAVQGFLHVDANLMCASCEKAALNERASLVGGEQLPLRDSLFSRSVEEDGHAFAIDSVTPDMVLDAPFPRLRDAVNDGEVDFGDAPLRECGGEAAMSGIVFRDDHAAAGVLVEPVDNAWAHFPPDAAEIVDVVQ